LLTTFFEFTACCLHSVLHQIVMFVKPDLKVVVLIVNHFMFFFMDSKISIHTIQDE
jgi:hypothetical protein